MNKMGFISIFIILVVGIVLLNTLFVFNILSLQNHISIASKNKTQSYLLLQDKINRLIYDRDNFNKYIKPKIIKNCRGTITRQSIDFGDDLELKKHIIKATVYFEEINNRKNIVIDMETKFNEISRFSKSYGTIINEIFEMDKNYVSNMEIENLKENYSEKFYSLIRKIEREISDYDFLSSTEKINTSGNIEIDKKSIRKNYREDGEDMYSEIITNYKPYNRVPLNIFKDKTIDKANLQFGESGNNEPIRFKGIVYVEGDIVIEQDVEYEGIIIVNGGDIIVNSESIFKVNGMIIHSEGEVVGDIRFEKNQNLRKSIYSFGSYLPGFIESNINVIKKY